MIFIGLFGFRLGFRVQVGNGFVLIEMSDVVIVSGREMEIGDKDSCADLRACA